ncbi:GntR family transcriptional regulator [Undibacterium sp. Ji49W]|uniref:GntR family transcriptional regulator n=1 Tax=Undibacterium sp. Ji49W TaxID=3413040 RepID=UPI003BF226F1
MPQTQRSTIDSYPDADLHVISEAELVMQLEEDILFLRLKPGERLVEDLLMQRFGATRHCVRQALNRLERTGIVMREPNKGARVRSFSQEEVSQIYEVREFLQRQAVLMFKLPAPPEFIDELNAIHQTYLVHVKNAYLRGVHELNDQFHSKIFSLCGNLYLERSIQDYMNLSYAIRTNSLAVPEKLQISVAHHALMIELLKGRDNWTLAQLCVDHILPSKYEYLAQRKASEAGNDA